ncbi:MAG: Gfo/Idh/MocA family oxidoreductase [Bacteroidia bacterium]|nr:Gfo/Idh/MocA family oxidoreductase [Bacteroidia bacterium]
MKKISIGLIGAGHLGSIHLKLLRASDSFSFEGVFDTSAKVREKLRQEEGLRVFETYEELLSSVEAVDIVTPTIHHFACAKQAIEAGKHVFIEKPLTHTLEEAEQLLDLLAARPRLKAQVGHVERFNPGFLAIAGHQIKPMFIEGHRLAIYNPRGTDVSVVFDLMIHDIDIVLSVVDSPLKSVQASGVGVISDSTDIANARLEFENGAVANLTASRISVKNMRRLRMFQRNTYLAVDFLEKKAEVFRLSDTAGGLSEGSMSFPLDNGDETRYLVFEQPQSPPVNSIQLELEEFAGAIRDQSPIKVGIEAGYLALKAAHAIALKIEESLANARTWE